MSKIRRWKLNVEAKPKQWNNNSHWVGWETLFQNQHKFRKLSTKIGVLRLKFLNTEFHLPTVRPKPTNWGVNWCIQHSRRLQILRVFGVFSNNHSYIISFNPSTFSQRWIQHFWHSMTPQWGPKQSFHLLFQPVTAQTWVQDRATRYQW